MLSAPLCRTASQSFPKCMRSSLSLAYLSAPPLQSRFSARRYSLCSSTPRVSKPSSQRQQPPRLLCDSGALPGLPRHFSSAPSLSHAQPRKSSAKLSIAAQYESLKHKYCADPTCLLAFQVGDFYEFYGEQAEAVSKALGMQMSKAKSTKNASSRMAGFPVHRGSYHMSRLANQGFKVFVAEQVGGKESREKMSIMRRELVRVYTKGTMTDELDVGNNNYAVYISGSIHPQFKTASLGLAWADASTGELRLASTLLDLLLADLANISPMEIITTCPDLHLWLKANEQSLASSVTLHHVPPEYSLRTSIPLFFPDAAMVSDLLNAWPPSTHTALAGLLSYLESVFVSVKPKLSFPEFVPTQDHMHMDAETRRSMDIFRSGSHSDDTRASLLDTIDNTCTALGKRLLKRHLAMPLLSAAKIDQRLDVVAALASNLHFTENIQTAMRACSDLERVTQRINWNSTIALAHLHTLEDFQSREALSQMDDAPVASLRHKRSLLAAVEQLGVLLTSLQACHEVAKSICQHAKLQTVAGLRQHTAPMMDPQFQALLRRLEQQVVPRQVLEQERQDSQDPESADPAPAAAKSKKRAAPKRKAAAAAALGDPADAAGELPSSGLSADDVEEEIVNWSLRPWSDADGAGASANGPPAQARLEQLLDAYAKRINDGVGAKSISPRLDQKEGAIRVSLGVEKGYIERIPELKVKRTSEQYAFLVSPALEECLQSMRSEGNETLKSNLQLLREVAGEVARALGVIQQVASALASIDVACSHAVTANELRFTRPTLTSGSSGFHVVGGFHPVIEKLMQQRKSPVAFVRNDCTLHSPPPRHGKSPAPTSAAESGGKHCWLITGANMGGKSTFMRQNALIAILAQIGSFVPADRVQMGIVDKIFARVGASDNIAENLSTFMVEMQETARILASATRNSLVIVDELGRGTATADGLAISWAVLQHLHSRTQCKLLFATHFHEMARMCLHNPHLLPHLACYHVEVVSNSKGGLIFTHRIVPGVSERSYGVEVAAMAGLPEEVIQTARAARKELLEQQKVHTAHHESTEQRRPLTGQSAKLEKSQETKTLPTVLLSIPEVISAISREE